MGIAAVHPRQRSLRQSRFDPNNRRRIQRGLTGRLSRQAKQLLNISHILLADLDTLRIGLQVVIAIRQA